MFSVDPHKHSGQLHLWLSSPGLGTLYRIQSQLA